MNRNRKLILLLVASLIMYFVSYLIQLYENRKANYIISSDNIEQILHPLERELVDIVIDVKEKVLVMQLLNRKDIDSLFVNNNLDKASQFSVFIYKNDSLKFWSKNSVPVPLLYNDSIFTQNKVIKLANGWYKVHKQKVKDCNILGLLKIKNNYYYDNQYLKSSFVIDENIPSEIIFSTSPISIGKDIKSYTGKYLFSLIPSQNIIIESKKNGFSYIVFLFSIFFFLIFVNILLKKISEKKGSFILGFIIVTLVILLVIFLLKYTKNSFLKNSFFFSEELYSGKSPFNSLGELFVYVSLITLFFVNLFIIFPFEKVIENVFKKNRFYISLILFTFIAIAFLYFLFISNISSLIIKNSIVSFDIQNFKEINIYNISAHIFLGLLFLSFIFFADHFIRLFSRLVNGKITIISVVLSIIVCYTFNFIITENLNILQTIILFIILLSLIFIRFYKQDYSYLTIISLIFTISVFFTFFENDNMQKKEEKNQKTLIHQLSNERDEMAERFLREVNNRMINDTVLIKKIRNVSFDQDSIIVEYLSRKYFYGYWEKYDLVISLCGNSEYYGAENQAANCEGYYSSEFNKFGEKVENTNFLFMNNNSGKITYSGYLKIPINIDNRELTLYITLIEKLVTKSLGYPKLLIDKSSLTKTEYSDYSYAKYKNGVLAVKSGKYSYDLIDKSFINDKEKLFYINMNNYKHLVLSNKTGQRIILSKEEIKTFDLIISFSYLFVFYNLIVFILILFFDYKFILKKFKFDFTNRLRFAMIFILIVSFVVFSVGTIFYTVKQNKKTTNKEIADKVQSVLVELKHKLQDEDELTPLWQSDKYDHLDELLIKFSQVFFSDINLYDLNGFLLATSRSEIFNRGLIGKQMDAEAFKMMSINKKTEFIHKEKIGELEFSSIYIPLKNVNNKIIAYINLPYFIKNDKFQKNISNVLITTLNLYVVLFLLTVFLAFIISTEITRPLRMLQSKFKAVQLGKKHQEIIYNKKDEIGELVKEYNLMVSKLEQSAKKLAESERESAWREMAKQIAHEIKNPLTPMKLSIQLLQKTWFEKHDNFEEFENRLNRVSDTLIEQINTLSSIASEFSAFAKMPKARKEEVNIVQKLKTVAGLFENTKNIKIILELNNYKNINIIADKEQVSRVFINLIKNSIQAIPKNKKGKIKISLLKKQNKVVIIVEDNGTGIPEDKKERLFEPSFTTKTTGMGIGLAIVRNIINSAGGDIRFESKVNKGTKFFVEFLKV